jgi:peptidoglycan hydrolase-like protein with peptidoglycan-binding domain
MGKPDENARNLRVRFADYIKSVACAELSPLAPAAALAAGIIAIKSLALHRIAANHYKDKNFDITASGDHDMHFNPHQTIFENISHAVDENMGIFARKSASKLPYAHVFKKNLKTSNTGLPHQAVTEHVRANKNALPHDILRHFFGEDIVLDFASPTHDINTLTPETSGGDVADLQIKLNRISFHCPAIPKIPAISGVHDEDTQTAVNAFRRVFGLAHGASEAVLHKIDELHTHIRSIDNIAKHRKRLFGANAPLQLPLTFGDESNAVAHAQHKLAVLSTFHPEIPPPEVSGFFDDTTLQAVNAFQDTHMQNAENTANIASNANTTNNANSPAISGQICRNTWHKLETLASSYSNALEFSSPAMPYGGTVLSEGMENEEVRTLQTFLETLRSVYPMLPRLSPTGTFGPVTKEALTIFGRLHGLNSNGVAGEEMWNALSNAYSDVRLGNTLHDGQFSGVLRANSETNPNANDVQGAMPESNSNCNSNRAK